jgi:hypothetical protein
MLGHGGIRLDSEGSTKFASNVDARRTPRVSHLVFFPFNKIIMTFSIALKNSSSSVALVKFGKNLVDLLIAPDWNFLRLQGTLSKAPRRKRAITQPKAGHYCLR